MAYFLGPRARPHFKLTGIYNSARPKIYNTIKEYGIIIRETGLFGLIKGDGVRIGVVACDIMKRELEKILPSVPEVSEVVWLEAALHCKPKYMKEVIKENINAIKDKVDVIFLGYGYCQSLKDIEAEFDIPIVMPQMDDCIQILMTPETYSKEIKKEVGTWFMTPGWAEVGVEMVIKENHLDRVVKYGKDPVEMAKRLFTHYKRGLYIDTGVGNDEFFIGKSQEFCEVFKLKLEKMEAASTILEEHLEQCKALGSNAETLVGGPVKG